MRNPVDNEVILLRPSGFITLNRSAENGSTRPHKTHHSVHYLGSALVLHVLADGNQQQTVLCQSLHGAHQDVGQPKSVALFVRLTPRQIRREEAIVPVQLPTIILTSALLRTVLGVRREQLRKGRESGHQIVDAHRMPGRYAVLDHREEVECPEREICLADLANVRKQFVLVDVGEEVLALDRFEARQEQLE